MAKTLKDYLATASHKGFNPVPRYYSVGDYLTYFARPDRCTTKRINELLTIYVAEDGSLVGCKVKGISLVMKDLKKLHVCVSDGKLTLGLLFVSLAALTKEAETRKDMLELASKLNPGAVIPANELPIAA